MTQNPIFLKGNVVKGFGRGSKELGIPTANLPQEVADSIPLETGIYYGWASLHGNIYKMVMSFGWNPFYKNQKRSAEVHLLHEFEQDFYGEELKVIIVGFLREERNYPSVDALIKDIHNDIQQAQHKLSDYSNYYSFLK